MRRLTIFASSNLAKFRQDSPADLVARGRAIFGSKERDKEAAARFLV